MTLSGTGFAGTAAVSSAIVQGYPAYYQDANGVRLAPCSDPTDPNCAVAPDPAVNPDLPISFPDNFPNEFFYTVANSEPLTITDGFCRYLLKLSCGAGTTEAEALENIAACPCVYAVRHSLNPALGAPGSPACLIRLM